MVFRTAWATCTAALLSLSVSRANGPAGGFFVARHQRPRQQLIDGQVQQRTLAIAPPLLDRKGRLGGLACGLGQLASTAAAALGGGGRRGGQESRKSTETVESSFGSDHDTAAAIAAEQNPGGVRPGFPGQMRGLSSPFEALSLTSRQLGQQASSTMAALGLREGKQRSATFLTRGGGGGGGAPQAPPQQVDRWKNAIEGLKNGLASGLAAACVKTVLQPFDTMKTVQQFSTTR